MMLGQGAWVAGSIVAQYVAPDNTSRVQKPPAQHSSSLVQGFAQVPLLSPTLPDSQQKPPVQLPLQHEVPPVLQVPPFGRHIVVVDVEVVLVDVEVVLVDVLVEVVVVVPHGSRWSPWPRWPSTALWGISMVCSSGVPGLWQMVTFFG